MTSFFFKLDTLPATDHQDTDRLSQSAPLNSSPSHISTGTSIFGISPLAPQGRASLISSFDLAVNILLKGQPVREFHMFSIYT
jgi:hypothetical protein